MQGDIFICYRRSQSQHFANRLRDALSEYYPEHRIFLDTEILEGGVDFPAALKTRLDNSAALLAVVGPNWATAGSADGNAQPRLHRSDDFVRREISVALDRRIAVIPVLHDGAQHPVAKDLPVDLTALAEKQSVEIRSSRVKTDVVELVGVLSKSVGAPMRSSSWGSTLFGLNGRIARKTFWLGYLGVFMVGSLMSLLLAVLLGSAGVGTEGQEVIVLIATFPFFWPLAALVLKRSHDFGVGWPMCLVYVGLCLAYTAASAMGLVPAAVGVFAVATILVGVVGAIPGQAAANTYGPVPREAIG